MDEVARNVAMLEKELGKKFGDTANPLLVSVRSGAAVSMPGMMNTILNLGLNDEAVVGLANATGNEAVCVRRLSPAHQHVRRRRVRRRARAFRSTHSTKLRSKYKVKNDTDVPVGRHGAALRGVQEGLPKAFRQAIPARPAQAARAGDRGGVHELDDRQGGFVSPHRRHHRPVGHGRELPVDGLRQHGR